MHMFLLYFLVEYCYSYRIHVTVLSIISKVDSLIHWRYDNMNTSASCNDKTLMDKDKNDQCHIIYRNIGV